jgi:hypothetical protein
LERKNYTGNRHNCTVVGHNERRRNKEGKGKSEEKRGKVKLT